MAWLHKAWHFLSFCIQMRMPVEERRAAAVAILHPVTQTSTSPLHSLLNLGSTWCTPIHQLGLSHREAWRWRSAGWHWPCLLYTWDKTVWAGRGRERLGMMERRGKLSERLLKRLPSGLWIVRHWGGKTLPNITITSLLIMCLYDFRTSVYNIRIFLPKKATFNLFSPNVNLYSYGSFGATVWFSLQHYKLYGNLISYFMFVPSAVIAI